MLIEPTPLDDPYALPLGEAGFAHARRWLNYLIELFGPIAALFAQPALEGRARNVLLSAVRRLEIFVRRLILAEAEKLPEMLAVRRNKVRKLGLKETVRHARAAGLRLTLITPRPLRFGYIRANPPPVLPSARASLRLAPCKARKKAEASGKPLFLPRGNKTLALRLEALRKALADPARLAKRWRRQALTQARDQRASARRLRLESSASAPESGRQLGPSHSALSGSG